MVLRWGGDKLVIAAGGFWTWWSTRAVGAMSAFGDKADIANQRPNVCF
jgi:hypothetical protein